MIDNKMEIYCCFCRKKFEAKDMVQRYCSKECYRKANIEWSNRTYHLRQITHNAGGQEKDLEDIKSN